MTQIPFYTVDAFTNRPFKGNPAAVCIFKHPNEEPSDELKQQLAKEFNLSETAFPLPLNGHNESNGFQTASIFSLRWFTPTNEVPLCGHATLATSHIIFNELGNQNKEIQFETKSGRLSVEKTEDGRLQMNFPQYSIVSLKTSFGSFEGLEPFPANYDCVAEKAAESLICGITPIVGIAYAPNAFKLIVVLDPKTTLDQFLAIQPKDAELLKIQPGGQYIKGIIITLAPENAKEQGFDDFDYVLRYFAPWIGISEDPATGSAQCAAAPFWHSQTGKTKFKAFQYYPGRGAQFDIELDNESKRIRILGRALTIFSGHFSLQIFNN